MAKRDEQSRAKDADQPLTLHPLSLEEALSGAMQTGRPPDRQKRSATKRRLKGENGEPEKPGRKGGRTKE